MFQFLKKIAKENPFNAGIFVLLSIYLLYVLFPSIVVFLQFVLKILTPFFLAVVLYYLLRPLVRSLNQRVPVYVSIAIAYILLFLFVFIVTVFVYPIVQEQIVSINVFHFKQESLAFFNFINYKIQLPQESKIALSNALSEINVFVINNVVNFFKTFAEFLLALFISLFILFYLLKEDKMIYENFITKIPEKYLIFTKGLTQDFDAILQHFINGRVIIAVLSGILLFIAFPLIGIDYPFILALTSTIFFVIPTIGCFLAMILPLIVGFSNSTFMGFEVLLIMGVVSILEGFLITPEVMGKKLYVHPLTIIFIFILSGYFYGILGLLFATPAYVMLKTLCLHIYHYFSSDSKKKFKTIKPVEKPVV